MASYVFCVKYDSDGVHINRFWDVSALVNRGSYEEWKTSIQVQQRMGVISEETEATVQLLRDLSHLPILSRYQGGVFLLHTEDDMELDVDELNTLLQHKYDQRELDSFLKEARIY